MESEPEYVSSIFEDTNSFEFNTLLYENNNDAQAWMFTTESKPANDAEVFAFVDFEGVQDISLLRWSPQELCIEAC